MVVGGALRVCSGWDCREKREWEEAQKEELPPVVGGNRGGWDNKKATASVGTCRGLLFDGCLVFIVGEYHFPMASFIWTNSTNNTLLL